MYLNQRDEKKSEGLCSELLSIKGTPAQGQKGTSGSGDSLVHFYAASAPGSQDIAKVANVRFYGINGARIVKKVSIKRF
jgi:hypothetical protein